MYHHLVGFVQLVLKDAQDYAKWVFLRLEEQKLFIPNRLVQLRLQAKKIIDDALAVACDSSLVAQQKTNESRSRKTKTQTKADAITHIAEIFLKSCNTF